MQGTLNTADQITMQKPHIIYQTPWHWHLESSFPWSKCEGPQGWKWNYNGNCHQMTGMDETSVLLPQQCAALFPTTS